MTVIVRIPPSPTGLLHIGTLRTALYNYLFAKQNNGKIIMRMEDTDKERSKKEYEENILSGLQKMGISWDGEVTHQSSRTEIYKKYLHKLIDEGHAYYCFCTKEELEAHRAECEKNKQPPRYPGTWRDADPKEVEKRLNNGEKSVIRFKTPDIHEDITFSDIVRGEVTINSKEIDDFVIAKDFNNPLYNFCVVVDDAQMHITHVIRGEDHISNTPKQILIFQSLGIEVPKYAHLPLILNSDKSKLSKRKNDVSVDDYLAKGYLKESLINFLALLGWNTSDENEKFTLNDLIKEFSLEKVHKGGAVFDIQKLEHINGLYIREMDVQAFAQTVQNYWKEYNIQVPNNWQVSLVENLEYFISCLSQIQERTKTLHTVQEHLALFYLPDDQISINHTIYEHKKMQTDSQTAKEAIAKSITWINEYTGPWEIEKIKEYFFNHINANEYKNGFILYPLRVALSGEEFSPGTFELMEIFGKERSLTRLKNALALLVFVE